MLWRQNGQISSLEETKKTWFYIIELIYKGGDKYVCFTTSSISHKGLKPGWNHPKAGPHPQLRLSSLSVLLSYVAFFILNSLTIWWIGFRTERLDGHHMTLTDCDLEAISSHSTNCFIRVTWVCLDSGEATQEICSTETISLVWQKVLVH